MALAVISSLEIGPIRPWLYWVSRAAAVFTLRKLEDTRAGEVLDVAVAELTAAPQLVAPGRALPAAL